MYNTYDWLGYNVEGNGPSNAENEDMGNSLENLYITQGLKIAGNEVKEEYGKLKTSLTDRQAALDESTDAYSKGNRSALDVGLTHAANTVGGVGDVFGSLMSAPVPDLITEPLGTAMSKIPTSTPLDSYLSEKFPDAYRMANNAVETGLGLFTGGKGKQLFSGPTVNQVARNADTKVDGFYSGNPAAKVAGIAKIGVVAVGRSIKELFTPQALASLRQTGIPEGMLQQNVRHLQALGLGNKFNDFDKLGTQITKLKEQVANASTPKGVESAKAKLKIAYNKKTALGKELKPHFANKAKILKLAKEAPSFQAGSEGYQGLMDKQTGTNSPLVKELFGPQVMSFGTLGGKGMEGVWDAGVSRNARPPSAAVEDAFKNHIIEAWGLKGNTNNVQILVKNPVDHHAGMGAELITNKTKVSRFLHTVAKELTPEHLLDTQLMGDVMRLRGAKSPTESIRNYVKYNDMLASGKPLSKPQQKNYDALNKEIDNLEPAKYNAEEGTWYFSNSHKSQAKELGGMNDWAALNTKDGSYTVIASDASDMVGVKPIGGADLITVFPPLTGSLADLSGKKLKGFQPKDPTYVDPIMEGSKVLTDKYGVPPVKRFPNVSPTTQQRMDVIQDVTSKVKPTEANYREVASNYIGAGTAIDNKEDE